MADDLDIFMIFLTCKINLVINILTLLTKKNNTLTHPWSY